MHTPQTCVSAQGRLFATSANNEDLLDKANDAAAYDNAQTFDCRLVRLIVGGIKTEYGVPSVFTCSLHYAVNTAWFIKLSHILTNDTPFMSIPYAVYTWVTCNRPVPFRRQWHLYRTSKISRKLGEVEDMGRILTMWMWQEHYRMLFCPNFTVSHSTIKRKMLTLS
jgi:hypothetical protein